MASFEPAQVARYYDDNTAAFLARGQGGTVGAIHRAVWGPGVSRRDEAFTYVESLVLERLRERRCGGPMHLLDLGCGVGASLCYLTSRLKELRGTGITLSAMQARVATDRIAEVGLAERARALHGDFCALPESVPMAHAVLAIESFVHAQDPAAFFASCAGRLHPGGLLILCDDFLGDTESRRCDARWLERFRSGWHINTLLDLGAVEALAATVGLQLASVDDLTPHLELGRPRDLAIALAMRTLSWLPIGGARWASLSGGHALQRCLSRGSLRYLFVVFERADE